MTKVIEAKVISEETVKVSVFKRIKESTKSAFNKMVESAKRTKGFIFNKETYTKGGVKKAFTSFKDSFTTDGVDEVTHEYNVSVTKTAGVGAAMGTSALLCILMGSTSSFVFVGMYFVIYAAVKFALSRMTDMKFNLFNAVFDVFIYGMLVPLCFFTFFGLPLALV